MILTIKSLNQNNEQFAPQTVAEAVLVKRKGKVIKLDEYLQYKQDQLSAPAGSGLTLYSNEDSDTTLITHSNSIDPTDSLQVRLFKYDNRGHIIESAVQGKLSIKVQGETIMQSGNTVDQIINFGDDFNVDNNNINLNWNNVNGDT